MSPARAAAAVDHAASSRSARATRRGPVRPRLRVIERARWWRRVPWGVVVAVLVFVACLFGALWTHVSLIGGQQRLDRLQDRISEERLHREELRRLESQLQGPDEVRRIAIEEYGMVDAAPAEAVPALPRVIRAQPIPGTTALDPEG